MTKLIKCAVVILSLALGAGCTATQSAQRAAVSYNRAYAESRNEVLLLNVLRAAAREPMQFSAMNQVSGAPREAGMITIPFNNILLGGAEAINPSLGLTARNPTVTIVPLEGREFRQGMATPVPLTLIDELTGQGWDRATALRTVIGGVVCQEKQPEVVELNLGNDPQMSANFDRVLADSASWTVPPQKGSEVATLRMTANELAAFLRQGAGEGRQIGAIEAVDAQRSMFLVPVLGASTPRVLGLNFNRQGAEAVCPSNSIDTAAGVQVLTRSPQSIIFFLAELHNRRLPGEVAACGQNTQAEDTLFRIRVACDNFPAPASAAVSVEYKGRRYYIPAAAEAGPRDQTLRVFTLLTELIALQTTAANLQSSRPILTIPQ
jgi:hypothetical protein